MSHRLAQRPAVTDPALRAAGAAPAPACGRKTKACTCTPKGARQSDRHRHVDHVNKTGACQKAGCKCTTYVARICSNPAMANGACWMHGGKSLKGAAAPGFRHGGASRYMPHLAAGNLAEPYARAAADPELLNLSAELALIEARIVDCLTRLATGLSRTLIDDIGRTFAEFETAGKTGNPAAANIASARLRALVAQGQTFGRATQELDNLIDLKRRVAEGQARIMKDTGDLMKSVVLVDLVRYVAEIVKRNVSSPKEISAIHADLARLLGPGDDAVPRPIGSRLLSGPDGHGTRGARGDA